MKKNFLKALSSVLLTALLLVGCQKVTEEVIPQNDANDLQNQASARNNDDAKCQLTRILWNDGYQYEFTYNRKNLANVWRITYAVDDYTEYQIKYNNNDRIKSTRVIDPINLPGDAINYTFFDNGNFTTRARGYLQSGGIWADVFYTYNSRGQMTKQDDVVNDLHIKFYYNNRGYNTQTDFFVGTDLLYQYLYEFDIPNKNPYLAVNGVDFGFPFYVLPLFDKRWESRGTVTYYEDGIPYIFYDLDAAQTTLQTGPHNYMTYSSFYDIATETAGNVTCTYQHCGGNNDDLMAAPSQTKSTGQLSIKNRLAKIFSRPSKNIKQQLKDFKQQYFDQLKPIKTQ